MRIEKLSLDDRDGDWESNYKKTISTDKQPTVPGESLQ